MFVSDARNFASDVRKVEFKLSHMRIVSAYCPQKQIKIDVICGNLTILEEPRTGTGTHRPLSP
jgi:hypothetical protein